MLERALRMLAWFAYRADCKSDCKCADVWDDHFDGALAMFRVTFQAEPVVKVVGNTVTISVKSNPYVFRF